MKGIKRALLGFILGVFCLTNLSFAASGSIYTNALDKTLQNPSLRSAVLGSQVENKTGADLVRDQVVNLIGYAIDVFIAIGIALAFIGGYKILVSDKEDAYKEGINILVYGVIGIIIMVSAKFIAGALAGDSGILVRNWMYRENISDKPSGIFLAQNLYEQIIYPFIRIALYLIVGVLFFMMAAKVVSFVISTDDVAKKKAGGVIAWTAIGMFIMLGAKQLVEAVMGNQDKVLDYTAKHINEMGADTLEFGTIPIISQIINWVMGLTMFVVLVLIIVQAYRIFAKPDDPKNRERIKKTLLYVFIGVLVIGASYVISNFLIINNIPET